jgi:hypothetical protein
MLYALCFQLSALCFMLSAFSFMLYAFSFKLFAFRFMLFAFSEFNARSISGPEVAFKIKDFPGLECHRLKCIRFGAVIAFK